MEYLLVRGMFAGKLPVRWATKTGLESVQAIRRLRWVGGASIDGLDCARLARRQFYRLGWSVVRRREAPAPGFKIRRTSRITPRQRQ